ncbi:MAG: cupin domain-containing protein [Acidobacteriota bacterium]
MKTTRLTTILFGTLAGALLVAPAISYVAGAQAPAHVMASLTTATWGPAPPMLPPGAQIAVLSGDPTKPVPYAVRLKFPANYDIPAHSHPTDEHVVVTSGDLFVGMAAKLDRNSGTSLGLGGFALMPSNMNHFAYTKGETTIVLYGQGPVEFKYVNATDDPRTKTATGRK